MNIISPNFVELPQKKDDVKESLVNDEITFEQVLVIAEDGEQLGVLPIEEALKVAEEREYDLVCVAPNAKTPVCKLMDYQKYRYELKRKAKDAKKNQKVMSVKEIQISPTIDTNDFEWKGKAARKFLVDGDKVKVTCRFRGRMIEQAEVTKKSFYKFYEGLSDVCQMDSEPKLDGRNMSMVISPIPEKKKN